MEMRKTGDMGSGYRKTLTFNGNIGYIEEGGREAWRGGLGQIERS